MKKKQFRKSVFIALVSLLVALFSASTATFAWYIYNTTTHTTRVQMAAGAGLNLQISTHYNGVFSSYTNIDESIVGILTPVSTDCILDGNGFQKVSGFTEADATHPTGLARIFHPAEQADYYKVSLFFKTTGMSAELCLADISFEDDDPNNPISTATRIGFVVHKAGDQQPSIEEYIFEINNASNPQKNYNTINGHEGCVLDHAKTDGSVIDFSSQLLDANNYCSYSNTTGQATVTSSTVKLCSLDVDSISHESTPVQIDVYIWLEGCDEDCTSNLVGKTLKNIALSFACIPKQ